MSRSIYYNPGTPDIDPRLSYPHDDEPVQLVSTSAINKRIDSLVERMQALEIRLAHIQIVAQADAPAMKRAAWAKKIGVSDAHLAKFIAAGQLRAVKMGEGTTMVLRDDLLDFLHSLPPVEPERKDKGKD